MQNQCIRERRWLKSDRLLVAEKGRERQLGHAVVGARFPALPFEGHEHGSGRNWHSVYTMGNFGFFRFLNAKAIGAAKRLYAAFAMLAEVESAFVGAASKLCLAVES